MKSLKKLDEFTQYCIAHPDLRFWQALRSWHGADFILESKKPPHEATEQDLNDTYYYE
ncbi:MAG: hypothetical protein V3T43_06290 [Nitrosomonadaceae bacterium]